MNDVPARVRAGRLGVALACALTAAHAPAQDVEFPDGRDAVEVPLLRHCEGIAWGLPLVEVAFGDRRELFLLDTGDSTITVDRELAAELDLSPVKREKAIAIGGTVDTIVYRGDALRIGDVVVWDYFCTDGEADFLGKHRGRRVRGGIGIGLFRDIVWSLDYPNGTCTLHRAETYEPTPTARALPTKINGFGLFTLVGELGDERSRRYLVDTGAELNLSLNAPLVRRLQLFAQHESWPGMVFIGYGGTETRAGLGLLTTFTLGPLTLRDVPVNLSRPNEEGGLDNNPTEAGSIGSSFFAPFRVTFGLRARTIWLESPPATSSAPAPPPNLTPTTGLLLATDGDALTLHVAIADTELSEPALADGDVLVAIDGEPPGRDRAAIHDRLLATPNVTLTVRRGDASFDVVYRAPRLPPVEVTR